MHSCLHACGYCILWSPPHSPRRRTFQPPPPKRQLQSFLCLPFFPTRTPSARIPIPPQRVRLCFSICYTIPRPPPPPPPTPTSRPPPATTTSTTTTSAEIEEDIPIGRPPVSRGSKPYTTRPPPLTSPNQAAKQGWGTSPFPSATVTSTEGEYSYPIPDKPYRPKYLPKTNPPATPDPTLSVTTRLSNHEARIIALETQLAALTRSPQGRSQGSFATPFRELGTSSTLTPTLTSSYPHMQTTLITKIPTPPAPSANLTSAKHNTAMFDFFRYQLDQVGSFHHYARLDCPDTP